MVVVVHVVVVLTVFIVIVDIVVVVVVVGPRNINLKVDENKKNPPMVPLWIVFNGEIKIVHLLPEESACRGDNFLKT